MNKTVFLYGQHLLGEIHVPSDKSISHRALMFGAISQGKTVIHRLLRSSDCLATMHALQTLGIPIIMEHDVITVEGKPLNQWSTDTVMLNLHNSGTSMRLLLGLLATREGKTTLIGDHSLQSRPMMRVIQPLTMMGASITSHQGKAPLSLEGQTIHSIDYTLPMASAQVKSAIILAGLHAHGTTVIHEPLQTRNHTELMLPLFGGKIDVNKEHISIYGKQQLTAAELTIPGDISSAAFFITAALITNQSEITLYDVGLNHTRTGFLTAIQKMGADIEIEQHDGWEPRGNITVRSSSLHAITLNKEDIPLLIDELPLIALLATQAEGITIVSGAEELAVKESDRLQAVADILTTLGATIEVTHDGWIIHGKATLHGGKVDSYFDHRMAMMATIASLVATSPIEIAHIDCISVSYPNFFDDLHRLLEKQ